MCKQQRALASLYISTGSLENDHIIYIIYMVYNFGYNRILCDYNWNYTLCKASEDRLHSGNLPFSTFCMYLNIVIVEGPIVSQYPFPLLGIFADIFLYNIYL